jgi:NAD+ diphosphatase
MADLVYNGLTLDRAPSLRADSDWLTTQRANPHARVIPFHNDKLVLADAPTDTETVFLGLDGDTPVFATEVDQPAGETHDLRGLVTTLEPAEAATLAYARGILHWNRNQRYCGACGGPTTAHDGGHMRVCQHCAKQLFPRIEPAVIVLVTWQDRCLLARHRGAAADAWSTLAGFIEVGENLEAAVRREVREEAGVLLDTVHYEASQAWPFPAGLMIGYRAIAASDAIDVDGVELDEARWFTAPEVRAMHDTSSRTDSIEHFLVSTWLARQQR